MKLKSCDVKTQVVGTIVLELTPQELASITAMSANTTNEQSQSSVQVERKHTEGVNQMNLYNKLHSIHSQIFIGGQ